LLVAWPGLNEAAPRQFDSAAPVWAERLDLKVLAVSPPGWETPLLEREEYLPTKLAARVIRMLDELEVERTTYVGFSWGASIGCHFAAIAPQRLRALVLLDAGYTDFQDRPDFHAQPFDDAVEAVRERWGEAVPPEAIVSGGVGVVEEQPSSTLGPLGRLNIPILLVASTETLAEERGRRALERFQTAVPRATVHTLESSHDLLGDAPEATIELVGSWLARI
jgi:pimeloyl-ACP methyl ester carboxylesterase